MSATGPTHDADVPVMDAAPRGAVRKAFEEQMIIEHLPLADGIARGFARNGRDLDDLMQVARMALVKAGRRFDPTLNPHFTAYARPTIIGEMKRYLRDSAWMVQPPRAIKDLHTQVAHEHPALCQSLGREPTLAELAGHLGEEPEVVAEAITSHNSLRPDSLDLPQGNLAVEDRLPDDTAEVFGTLDDELSLAEALRTLAPDEKQLLHLRFYEERSQQQIGDGLGMTQVQVSRALARILVKLQRQILNRFPGAGAHGEPAYRRCA